jgi:hypothetical protein
MTDAEGDAMRTVKVQLHAADLAREVAVMREWLDRNGYEPRKFNLDQDRDTVVLSIEFMVDAAAEAFARRFDGESGPPFSVPGQLALAVE